MHTFATMVLYLIAGVLCQLHPRKRFFDWYAALGLILAIFGNAFL